MSRRVLLHVGTPKTGTSYLQDVLFRNRATLRSHGINYPVERHDGHFLAALDLMKMPWGGLQSEAVGAWDRLADAVREYDKTSIVSHEILATASRSQAARALASLGHEDGPEIHLILSVRDLTRQIPAEWQENIKHRSTFSYEQFLKRISNPARKSRVATWFWGVQEIPAIIDRWAPHLPPEQVHLITVPPPGGDKTELWRRFEEGFGLTGLDLDLEAERANPSLGVPETALIRRINRTANNDVPPEHYRPLVRELLAHRTLSARTKSPRLSLPPDLREWASGIEQSYVDAIERRGYHVIGDVKDLLGQAPDADAWADPDRPRERQVASAGVAAIKALLLENARLREVEADLTRQRDEANEALERAHLRPTYRLREKVVRRLETSTWGQRALRVYRRARGRNSRSA